MRQHYELGTLIRKTYIEDTTTGLNLSETYRVVPTGPPASQ